MTHGDINGEFFIKSIFFKLVNFALEQNGVVILMSHRIATLFSS